MKVAIDLRPLQLGHESRGIGAYLLNLLQRLPDNQAVSYVFLRYDVSDPIKDYLIDVPGTHEEVVVKKQTFSKKLSKLLPYVLTNLIPPYRKLMRHHPDVFFQPDYMLGAPKSRSCRVVVVSYDLIPFRMPAIYMPHWTKYLRFSQHRLRARTRMMLRALFYDIKFSHAANLLRRADSIISISKNTSKDLVELVGVKQNSIKLVYPAASFRSNQAEDTIRTELKNEIDAIKSPIIAYVGGTDQRRQVEELIFAFNLYNARIGSLDLVLCGSDFEPDSIRIPHKLKSAIANSSYQDNLHVPGKVTEAEKKYVLSKASAFVYPTLYEGFGLPLLEAMQCGTPIISYKNSSIPEVAEDVPVYTDGIGGYAIFTALREFVGNDKNYDELIKKGINRASQFNWEDCSRQVWKIVLD